MELKRYFRGPLLLVLLAVLVITITLGWANSGSTYQTKDTSQVVQLIERGQVRSAVLTDKKTDNFLSQTKDYLTILAPTNEAFKAIGGAVNGLSVVELTQILEYHVLSGAMFSTDFNDGEKVKTLQGGDVTITVDGDEVFLDAARIVNANIFVGEGVLHIIDSVLDPRNTTAKVRPSATTPAAPVPSGPPTTPTRCWTPSSGYGA